MNTENINAIATIESDEKRGFVADLTAPRKQMFCSLDPKDVKGQAQLFKIMNNPDKRVKDCINMTIKVKDLFVETVTLKNEEGVFEEAPRIVLVDDKGVGYQCVSKGILSALQKLIMIFGQPTWETPLSLKVVQISKGNKSILTFELV